MGSKTPIALLRILLLGLIVVLPYHSFAQNTSSSLIFIYREDDKSLGIKMPVKLKIGDSLDVAIYNNSFTVISCPDSIFSFKIRNFFENYFKWQTHTVKLRPPGKYYFRCGFSPIYTQIDLTPVTEEEGKKAINAMLVKKAASAIK